MQAIAVKFHGPTNNKPPRVQASAGAGKGPMLGVYGFAGDTKAVNGAATALAEKFKWGGRWASGDLADGSVVFVCIDPRGDFRIVDAVL